MATKKLWLIIFLTLGLLIALYFIFCFVGMRKVKTPQYEVVQRSKTIERRKYPPLLIAEVSVSGPRRQAIRNGFKTLADYIFKNNIPMTTPVSQHVPEKIAMTAPVLQQGNDQQWLIQFIMPEGYTLETLPKPVNTAITIKQQPAREVVAIRFSGLATDDLLSQQQQQLQRYIGENKIKVINQPIYAFYNPPWTIPFLRRNEVQFEVLP